ncbi:MAG: FkbM family methyltransferase [Bacteroidota bacterium]
MQKTAIDSISAYHESGNVPVTDLLARPIERIRLQHRAEKYRTREDRGGIAYIQRSIKEGAVVFDIGAHKAGYLYFFLEQLQNNGAIHAFEPQPVLYQYLQKLKRLFSWNNVKIEAAAVSDHSGTALLSIPYNNGRASSPCATIIESRMDLQIQSRVEVNTISLDEYCDQHHTYPDFLKVDVEGNELSVFKGAANMLFHHKPKILFECEARFVGEARVQETFSFLQQLGYTGYYIMGNDVNHIQEFHIDSHQRPGSAIYCNNFIFE